MIKKLFLSFCAVLFCIITFSQETDNKTVTYFEKYIIAGNIPPDTVVQTKYENNYRFIVWNDPLIKDYKYSNEAFDKLGYEFVKTNAGDNLQSSKIYRSCSKGIIIEVTKWYGLKLSISMKWFPTTIRKSVGDLMYCDVKNQSKEEVVNKVSELIKQNKINADLNRTYTFEERWNPPVLLNGSKFLNSFYYKIILINKNYNPYQCWQLQINEDGSTELETYRFQLEYTQAEYDTLKTLIKNEMIFSNPKVGVNGDSIYVNTSLKVKFKYDKKYLGVIKTNYDSKDSSVTIKSKEIPAEIKTEELKKYFKDKDEGTYKLSYYKVSIFLFNNCNEECKTPYRQSEFIYYKPYEKGDELITN